VRKEGDMVHLDETLVDLGFVGEDVKTGRVELCGERVHSSAPERKHIIEISCKRVMGLTLPLVKASIRAS
jgi:hypothetical protein